MATSFARMALCATLAVGAIATGLVAAGLGPLGGLFVTQAQAASDLHMQVNKDPNCGCCTEWIEIMQQSGFQTEVRDMPNSELYRLKAASGIQDQHASCHTAMIDGYVIEGHVPAADIKRLLDERPDAIGLAVPGMPFGSPGMGPEDQREAYDVVLIGKDGQTQSFSHYPAGTR